MTNAVKNSSEFSERRGREGAISPDFHLEPEIAGFLEQLRAGAAERESNRYLPKSEIRELAQMGLGALRVPKNLGGSGWELGALFNFIYELSKADANIAHAVRNHYLFIELLLTFPDDEWRNKRLQRAANGAIIGEAHAELGGTTVGLIQTSLLPRGSNFALNGTKYYSTGSIFADFIWVSAVDVAGNPMWVDLPTDRRGIVLKDDWDGFGQRLTGSGTTIFEDVLVHPEEISPADVTSGKSLPRQSVFAQLYMTTVVAGIVGNIASDAVDLLRSRTRRYKHAGSDHPQEDPLLLAQVGYLSSYAYTARAATEAAIPPLDRVAESFNAGGDYSKAGEAASLAAANAKLTVDEIALKAATLLLDVGGASATSAKLGLDRHWRNARTLSSHNPRVHKARGIGDHLVNNVSLPQFFF